MFKLISKKKLANNLEKGLANLLNAYNCFNNGVDLIKDDLFIEVKSANRYLSYKNPNRKSTYRFGNYSFKPNEVKDSIDWYIFIEKINKPLNLKYIKDMLIHVVKTSDLIKYFKQTNRNLNKRLQISVNQIRKIRYISLNDLINKIG